MNRALAALSFALIVSGVALWSVPAGLIAAGVLLVLFIDFDEV